MNLTFKISEFWLFMYMKVVMSEFLTVRFDMYAYWAWMDRTGDGSLTLVILSK